VISPIGAVQKSEQLIVSCLRLRELDEPPPLGKYGREVGGYEGVVDRTPAPSGGGDGLTGQSGASITKLGVSQREDTPTRSFMLDNEQHTKHALFYSNPDSFFINRMAYFWILLDILKKRRVSFGFFPHYISQHENIKRSRDGRFTRQ